MKRPISLAVVLALLLPVAGRSGAAEIKAEGEWMIEALFGGNGWDFTGRNDPRSLSAGKGSAFDVWTRLRTQFDFVVSEDLRGVLATEIGSSKWGASGVYDLGRTPVAVGVRRAYIDFNLPRSKANAKIGFQGVTLPNEIGEGSFILDDELSAVLLHLPLADSVGLLAVYGRPLSGNPAYSPPAPRRAFMDLGILSLPVNFEKFRVNPFAMYAYSAAEAASQTAAYPEGLYAQNATAERARSALWLGVSFGLDVLDPVRIRGDLNYGRAGAARSQDRKSGWLFDLAVEYTGLSFATPELLFAWTSGESGNATTAKGGASTRMPILTQDDWAVGSFFFGGETLMAGAVGARESSQGFWALGLSLKDMRFAEKLSHTVHVLYVRGTNSRDVGARFTTAANQGNAHNVQFGRTLTTRDSLWEFDCNSRYPIHPGLTASLELGLLVPHFSSEVWGSGYSGAPAHKVSLGLLYEF